METRHLIAHAVGDENQVGYMQNFGDQTGHELCAVKWYKYTTGWIAVYRPLDKEKAEGYCQFMENAITNGFIGYDQNRTRRKAFFDAVEGLDFKVDELNDHRSIDCGGLVYTALYSQYRVPASNAEYDLNVPPKEIFGIPTTGLFDEYLMNDVRDFVKYTDADYLDSDEKLQRGDILLANGHVAIYI